MAEAVDVVCAAALQQGAGTGGRPEDARRVPRSAHLPGAQANQLEAGIA